MNSGQVQLGTFDSSPVLKFVGDVRLTLCTTIDSTIDSILNDSVPSAFWLDLSEAENIDSTCLGLIARLSMRLEAIGGDRPALCGVNPDLTDLIHSMAMEDLFDWQTCAPSVPCAGSAVAEPEPEAVQKLVISAHKDLMSLCSENEARFKDLVSALENAK